MPFTSRDLWLQQPKKSLLRHCFGQSRLIYDLHCNKCSEDALEDIDIALSVSTIYAEQLSTYIPDLHTKLTA